MDGWIDRWLVRSDGLEVIIIILSVEVRRDVKACPKSSINYRKSVLRGFIGQLPRDMRAVYIDLTTCYTRERSYKLSRNRGGGRSRRQLRGSFICPPLSASRTMVTDKDRRNLRVSIATLCRLTDSD